MRRGIALLALLASQMHAQSGRVNYFLGKDSRHWLRDLPSPAAANAGLDYATFLGGSGGQHTAAITTDSAGNVYIAGSTFSKDFPVTPDAFQGGIAPGSRSGQTAFAAKFSAQGALIYCTYLGGNGDDQAFAIAVDLYGNAYIAGETTSINFPASTGAILASPGLSTGTLNYAFVTKLNSVGNAILYSTLLSPGSVKGIAVDNSGDAFVTGVAIFVDTFPITPGAISSVQAGGAFLAKINPAGSRFIYATGLEYSGDFPNALAVDSAGNAYVAGATTSQSVRAGNSFQPRNAVRTLSITSDSGAHWRIPGPGLEGQAVNDLAVDGKTGAIFAATNSGLYRSADGGNSWSLILSGQVFRSAIDPGNSNHVLALLYVPSLPGYTVYSTLDGGLSWKSSGWGPAYSVVFDATQPSNVYAILGGGCYYSRDGGQTFAGAPGGCGGGFRGPFIDPFNHNTIYSAGNLGLYVSVNAGVTYSPRYIGGVQFLAFTPDPSNPNVLYASAPGSFFGRRLARSTDGGLTWEITGSGLFPSYLAFDPTDKSTLYAVDTTGGPSYVARSTDRGATFQAVPSLPENPFVTSLSFDPQHPGTFYAISSAVSDAFVTKVSPDGGTVLFSTYFGGAAADSATGIALDSSGNIYVTGNTNSPDLNGAINSLAGGTDAFIVKLSNDGTQLAFSRYIGGVGNDTANGIALDSAGNIYIAGSTFSSDFPLTADALQTTFPAGPPAQVTGYLAPFIGFFTRFDNSGAILSSSFAGGAEGDTAYAVAVDPSGRLCIAGDTNSPDLAITAGAAQSARIGGTDAFVMIVDFNH